MELGEAKELLDACTRHELRDHAFGDMEVSWTKDGIDMADGYFGRSMASVTIGGGRTGSFSGADAHELASCGTLGVRCRNDETGPDDFHLGEIQPGLSVGDVFHELTGAYMDETQT